MCKAYSIRTPETKKFDGANDPHKKIYDTFQKNLEDQENLLKSHFWKKIILNKEKILLNILLKTI